MNFNSDNTGNNYSRNSRPLGFNAHKRTRSLSPSFKVLTSASMLDSRIQQFESNQNNFQGVPLENSPFVIQQQQKPVPVPSNYGYNPYVPLKTAPYNGYQGSPSGDYVNPQSLSPTSLNQQLA